MGKQILTKEQIDARIEAVRAERQEERKRRAWLRTFRKRFMESSQTGYNVVYNHFRYDHKGKLRRYVRGWNKWTPTLYGGLTVCVAVDKSTGEIFTGYGNCDKADRFVYATGRWHAWDAIYERVYERMTLRDFEASIMGDGKGSKDG